MKKFRRKKSNLKLIIFLILICCISLGYAIFTQELVINGTVTGSANFRVYFAEAWIKHSSLEEDHTDTPNGKDEAEIGSGTVNINTAQGADKVTFEVTLNHPGDKVLIGTKIKNESSIRVKLNDFLVTKSVNIPDINLDYIPLSPTTEKLDPNGECTYEFIVEWDAESSEPNPGPVKFTIDLDYEQDPEQGVPEVKPSHDHGEGELYLSTYNITYILNEGTLDTSNPDTYTSETANFTLNNPTKTGYTFKGWSGTDLTGDTNQTVTISQGSTGDREYTANWTPYTYTIVFNANNGTGTMPNKTINYGESTNLTKRAFAKTGYKFVEWNTENDGTGTSYTDEQLVSNLSEVNGDTITLYAIWELQPTKYAVQIYGINQDVDSSGNPLGLTFGPAVGANYNNSYVTHEYEETSSGSGIYNVKIVTHLVDAYDTETISSEYLKNSSGANVTRTEEQKNMYDINIHNMTWTEISQIADKEVFKDCMLCGDTKSVSLNLNGTIGNGNVYDQYGDGAGTLFSTIKNTTNNYYCLWNPNKSQNSYVGTNVSFESNETNYGSNARNAGGYSSSHIRATLIGQNNKTNLSYAGNKNLNTDTCLFSCIESDLQAVITEKKVKYITSTNIMDDIADSIWLFSEREMYGTGEYSGDKKEGLGTNGDGYEKFGNTESKYNIASYDANNNAKRIVYNENGEPQSWWVRSPIITNVFRVRVINIQRSLWQRYYICRAFFSFWFLYSIV